MAFSQRPPHSGDLTSKGGKLATVRQEHKKNGQLLSQSSCKRSVIFLSAAREKFYLPGRVRKPSFHTDTDFSRGETGDDAEQLNAANG